MGGIVKNAPNAIIWAVCLCFLGVIAAFVVLAVTDSDATELRTLMNTVLNIASTVLSGGALVVAGAAAKSAHQTEQQTNGLQDEERAEIAHKAAQAAVLEYRRGGRIIE